MSLPVDERRVLLAAAASPLRHDRLWSRTDLPGGLSSPIDLSALWSLVRRGLIRLDASSPPWPRLGYLTDAGLEEAEAVRSALGETTRQLLRQIDEADELVRRERPATDEEYCEIIGCGGSPTEQIVEWVAPYRGGQPPRLPPGPANVCVRRAAVPIRICYGDAMHRLVGDGLVILLAGGTRAALTGAGRWCAAPEAPGSDSEAGEGREATGGAQDGETASEGRCGPSTRGSAGRLGAEWCDVLRQRDPEGSL